AEHVLARHRAAVLAGDDRFAQRVERARADVAVDDTDAAERERQVAALVAGRAGGPGGWCLLVRTVHGTGFDPPRVRAAGYSIASRVATTGSRRTRMGVRSTSND